jgi:hypothetical protein
MITCEFIQGSRKETGTGFISHDVFCGKPAARYRCEGELASITMHLCEHHKNFVVSNYKWKVALAANQAS